MPGRVIGGDPDEPVGDDAVAIAVDDDATGRQAGVAERLDRDHVAVANCGSHAAAAGAKPDAVSLRQQIAAHVGKAKRRLAS